MVLDTGAGVTLLAGLGHIVASGAEVPITLAGLVWVRNKGGHPIIKTLMGMVFKPHRLIFDDLDLGCTAPQYT